MCKECENKPVILLPESTKLCRSHFLKYFEGKVARTIRKYDLIGKKDSVAVAISGGKDSLTTLHILNQLLQKEKRKIQAILVDEGIRGYRDKTIKDAKTFCKKEGIKLTIVSFKKNFGKSLDEVVKSLKKLKAPNKVSPCGVCGVFRRSLLAMAAKELKITKLATGHNLDDECQSIIMNQLKVNLRRSAGLGPASGINSFDVAQRIKPLYFLSEKEVATYAYLKRFEIRFGECPYSGDSFRSDIRDMLNTLEEKHPGSKHAIVNSFLETLPLLKTKYKESSFGRCAVCHEPSANKVCNTCQLSEKLGLKRIKVAK